MKYSVLMAPQVSICLLFQHIFTPDSGQILALQIFGDDRFNNDFSLKTEHKTKATNHMLYHVVIAFIIALPLPLALGPSCEQMTILWLPIQSACHIVGD